MNETIGVVGLGLMGQGIAHCLQRAGYALRVYNRDASKTEAFIRSGAQRGEHPDEAVVPGGLVMTMVADDAALENVTLGERGILAQLGPGGVHISLSTVSPAIATRMAELHRQLGCFYLAAPVFGRPDAAAAGQLAICLAGNEAAKERVRPVLSAISQGIFDFGTEPAQANVVKASGNFLINAAMEAMAEALALAEKNGVDRTAFIDFFGQTIFNCRIYQSYGRMLAEKRYTPVGFPMHLALKDNNLVRDAAEHSHVPMPLANLNHDRLMTGIARGRAESDWVALGQLVDEAAGL